MISPRPPIIILFSLFLQLFFLPPSHAEPGVTFQVGANQAWWKTNYSSQWIYPYFDGKEVIRLLDVAAANKLKIFRVWLFEGIENQSFSLNGNQVILNESFLPNFEFFLKAAKDRKIQVAISLFDGNVINEWGDRTPKRDFIYNLWLGNNPPGENLMENFRQAILFPIFSLIASKYKGVVTQIDVMNEIDALVFWSTFIRSWGVFPNWKSANRYICAMSKAIKQIYPEGKTTASVGWWQSQNHILDGTIDQSCVDFFDIHLYNDTGEIPRCEDFKTLGLRTGKFIQLGEFGQKSSAFSDELQDKVTYEFIKNAKACNFRNALAWRLSDVRPGNNGEARFSYEANGAWRSALKWLNTDLWSKGILKNPARKKPARNQCPWASCH
ncbi:MAG: cellulase family glycosylhydrolase [Bacteriovoracaceae bacterium]|nr:cellulase family glycosylhydrolase [Bacteriovoracaceae bacterium]